MQGIPLTHSLAWTNDASWASTQEEQHRNKAGPHLGAKLVPGFSCCRTSSCYNRMPLKELILNRGLSKHSWPPCQMRNRHPCARAQTLAEVLLIERHAVATGHKVQHPRAAAPHT